MPKRLALLVLSAAAFGVSWVALQLLAGLAEWAPPMLPRGLVAPYILALLGAPVAVACLVARALPRRWRSPSERSRRRTPRAVLWAIMTGYALTTVIGIPAAQSRRDAWAVEEYRRLRASGSPRVWEAHPYLRTYVAIPVLPCVILSYHEYQLDGLYGLGAFEIAVWYGIGVSSADVWPLWIS